MKKNRTPETRPRLADFQRMISGAVMCPLGRGEKISAESANTAAALVKPNSRLSAAERLQIYNQQYWWRLLGSMREDFTGLLAVLGERKFEKLSVAYIEQCGSTSWSLRNLGQGLEAFVQAHPGLIAPRQDLALDMIRAEWARVIAYDGPSKPLFNPSRTNTDPSSLRLGLQPHLSLLEVSHPVDRLLGRLKQKKAVVASNAVSASASGSRIRISAKPSPTPLHLAVYRIDLSVYFKRLDPQAYTILSLLRSGATLGEACSLAFGDGSSGAGNAAESLRTWFAEWSRLGWLTKPASVRGTGA